MLDTSRNYGFGKSEELIALAIEKNGGWPKDFILSTTFRFMKFFLIKIPLLSKLFFDSMFSF